MKTIKKLLMTAMATFMLPSFVSAQKMGHLQYDSLMQMMPESKQALEIAQGYLKDLEKQVASMKSEFDAKYQDYMSNEPTMSDLVKKTKQQELQDLNQRIEDFRTQAQQDYQKKTQELSAPIKAKAQKAVETVAKENGFKYVFDTSSGMVLFADPGENILTLVKKKLDSMPPAVLPTGNGGTPKGGGGTPKGIPKGGGIPGGGK